MIYTLLNNLLCLSLCLQSELVPAEHTASPIKTYVEEGLNTRGVLSRLDNLGY